MRGILCFLGRRFFFLLLFIRISNDSRNSILNKNNSIGCVFSPSDNLPIVSQETPQRRRELGTKENVGGERVPHGTLLNHDDNELLASAEILPILHAAKHKS